MDLAHPSADRQPRVLPWVLGKHADLVRGRRAEPALWPGRRPEGLRRRHARQGHVRHAGRGGKPHGRHDQRHRRLLPVQLQPSLPRLQPLPRRLQHRLQRQQPARGRALPAVGAPGPEPERALRGAVPPAVGGRAGARVRLRRAARRHGAGGGHAVLEVLPVRRWGVRGGRGVQRQHRVRGALPGRGSAGPAQLPALLHDARGVCAAAEHEPAAEHAQGVRGL
mmetsp:Transcript_617/g.2503  ORF Transcript_617/g.2503 Transcript_617/m.2503 type:complete len:223 (-) Transcript_617:168-836(-)